MRGGGYGKEPETAGLEPRGRRLGWAAGALVAASLAGVPSGALAQQPSAAGQFNDQTQP
ncbi:hypothetical protein HNR01_003143, partial [Methylorubrum rhodesianum]|nr:hypothetical protein [Methylorubrum rhodesianum]